MNFICDHKNVTAGQKRRKDKCINKGKNEKYADLWIVSGEKSRRTNVWKIHIGKNKETKWSTESSLEGYTKTGNTKSE